MSKELAFLFHMIPHEKIEQGTQVLLTEGEQERTALYEGQFDYADELILTALIRMENQIGNTPILLVNQSDFDNGMYKTKYDDDDDDDEIDIGE